MGKELNLGIGFAARHEKEGNLLVFEPRQRPDDLYNECARMTIDLLAFLKHLGVGAKDLQGYAKSLAVKPTGKISDIIGEDTSDENPYSAFWKLMKVWPRGQNQKAREAAVLFREAVDSGTPGGVILEAAKALIDSTTYVSRLDLWLKNEGYLMVPEETKSTFKTCPPASFDIPNPDEELWF